MGEMGREFGQPGELLLVARLAPRRMVTILLTAGGIEAGRLDGGLRIGVYPHPAPRRRNAERQDTHPRIDVADGRPVGMQEAPAAPAPDTRDAGGGVDRVELLDGTVLHEGETPEIPIGCPPPSRTLKKPVAPIPPDRPATDPCPRFAAPAPPRRPASSGRESRSRHWRSACGSVRRQAACRPARSASAFRPARR